MGMRMVDVFPPVNELLNLEPEEIGPFLLEYLNILETDPTNSILNRYNLTLNTNPSLREYAQTQVNLVARVLTEAWMWLEREGFLAPDPNHTGEWTFITRKGKKLRTHTDFTAYHNSYLLPKENLDPKLLQKVRPLFVRGDYDLAIFQAYKEVEVRIRKACDYGDEIYGVDLARKAFNPDKGPLTDQSRISGEKEAMMHLFAGSLGAFKNPGSHREVSIDNPNDASEVILFANYLLRVVDARTPDATESKQEAEQAVPPRA